MTAGIGVGAATIPITPDLDGFANDLRRGLTRMLGRGVDVPVSADVDRFRREISREVARTGGVSLDVTADTAGLRREVEGELARAAGDVDVTADATGFRSDIRSELARAGGDVEVGADTSGLRGEVADAISGGIDDGFGGGVDAGGGIGGGGAGAGLLGGLAARGGAAGLAGGLALGAGVLAGFSEVLERDQIADRLEAQLELQPARVAELAELATGIYEDAWGDSVLEVTDNLGVVTRTIGDLGDRELRDATTRAMDFASTFDEEVADSIRAAQNLVANGLARDIEHAQDLLATGFQRGLDIADDLLDTVNEYAAPLGELGLSGGDIFAGLQGSLAAGTRDTDKIVDALKEFGVLALEERGRTAIELLGLDSESIAFAVAEGGPAARQALLDVLEQLRAVPDAEVQELLGRDIFGTMFEDATARGVLAFDPLLGTFDDVGGAAQQLSDELNDNLITTGKEIVRTGMGGLLDFLEEGVVPTVEGWADEFREGGVEGLLDAITGQLEGGADDISDAVQGWAPAAISWVADAIPRLTEELPDLLDEFTDWVTGEAVPIILEEGGELAGAAVDWVEQAAEEIGPELGKFVGAMAAWIVTDGIPELVKLQAQWSLAITEWIVTDAIPALPGLWLEFQKAMITAAITAGAQIGETAREEWVPALLEFGPEAVERLPEVLAQIGDGIIGWVRGLRGEVADAAVGIFTGLYIGFAESWNSIVGFLNEQGDILSTPWGTVGLPDLPAAPMPEGPSASFSSDGPGGRLATAADGALLTEPTVILAAEVPRAQPEIVSPVAMMRRIVREESAAGAAGLVNFFGDVHLALDAGEDDVPGRLRRIGDRFTS